MKRIRIPTALVIPLPMLLGVLLAAGCKPANENAPTTPAKPRVALIMKSLGNEFFLTMENGAKAHQLARSSEDDLLANGIKDELDVSRQIDLVEQMIAQRDRSSSEMFSKIRIF